VLRLRAVVPGNPKPVATGRPTLMRGRGEAVLRLRAVVPGNTKPVATGRPTL
jgi:hypothetical protein